MRQPIRQARETLEAVVRRQARRMRGSWQMFFLPGALIYGLTLLNLFYLQPEPRESLSPYLRNLDLFTFFIAIAMAVAIFNMKRTYFSRRFIRKTMDEALRRNEGMADEELLERIFGVIRARMTRVWALGLGLILLGVAFHWATFAAAQNLHTYFVIGAFSLIINYPRAELFSDMPWYLLQERQARGEASAPEDDQSSTST